MKLGVFTALFNGVSAEETFKILHDKGVEMVELGVGGFPGNAHCDAEKLLSDDKALEEFKALLKKYNLEISALSCHGNPVHPDKEKAAAYDKTIKNAILLSEKLGLHQINTFSGCPGDCENSNYPNWVTCPWPDDFLKILDWQWNEKLVPYWKDTVKFAKEHGVDKIALELHPGFAVYNTESLLKLRRAVGPEIGANFDPSHLIWQGMDPVEVIKVLGAEKAIFHFHAKDTKIDERNRAVGGVLDLRHYSNVLDRAWSFRTVGYGNDMLYWKDIISALKLVGYDYAISIEHEDNLMSVNEGLTKAIEFLKPLLITEKTGEMWWA